MSDIITLPTRHLAVEITIDHDDPRATDDVGDEILPLLGDARVTVVRAAPDQRAGVTARVITSTIGPGSGRWSSVEAYDAAVDECDRIAAWVDDEVKARR